MNFNHWVLTFLWIAYCCMHSLLAATKAKLYFRKFSGNFFRYYRLIYSIVATISLVFLLYFQYSFASPPLIDSLFLKYATLIIFVLPGFLIMIISILKYFKSVSGIDSFYQTAIVSGLHLKGIHNYVRHPLYSGTLLFIWGLFFIFPMLNNLIAVVTITIYVIIGIRFEERKLIREFEELYTDYRSKVPMLIPHFRRQAM